MLVMRPFFLIRFSKKPLAELPEASSFSGRSTNLMEDEDSFDSVKASSHEDHTEIIVHSVIETIEFVLGSISNTASYLRLWALSLAHKQLAYVFFDLTVGYFLKSTDNFLFATLGITVAMFSLMQSTVGIIMCMDVMECFLHAIRLHW